MDFEWDENKNSINNEKHGFDFNMAKLVFLDKNRVTFQDKRKDYGESRWVTIGKMNKIIIVVVFTIRNMIIRIISARIANRKERKMYENH